jgi:hypothetical protein
MITSPHDSLGEVSEDIRFSPQVIIPLLRKVGLIEE